MIAWPPPTASRIGWPRRGWIIAAPCSISPATPTIAAFPYATAGRERRLARSGMTRWPSSAPSANSGDRSSTNRSANGLSTTATATARVMGWLISRPASAKIVSLVKLSLRKFIAVLRCYETRTSYSHSDEGWHQLFRRDGRETTVGQSRQDPAPQREWCVAPENEMPRVDTVGLKGSAQIRRLKTDGVVVDRLQIGGQRTFKAGGKPRI